jgi:pimeloyl-ACP methyl ester carboxylesterase
MITTLRRLFQAQPLKGPAQRVDQRNVRLGGLFLEGSKADLPNLLFFPELLDSPSSWVPFFGRSGILDYRNVYILNPRNIGNSDRTGDMHYLTMAEDVARLMYEHRISTATLGGHGIGAKVALAFACLHGDRTTGYFGIDSSPMDQRNH